MGDFFELFFDDAQVAAPVLDIALTARGEHDGAPIPMCGVPVHAAEGYLARLIRAGHRVAIAEQIESPAEAKKRGGSKALVNARHRPLRDRRHADRGGPARFAPRQLAGRGVRGAASATASPPPTSRPGGSS